MSPVNLANCICLGGYGYPIAPGDSVDLTFRKKGVTIESAQHEPTELLYLEVASIDISGPGTTVTGGGFVGGGFGVEGAVEGIAIAAILNRLTKKSQIHTFVFITTNVGEIHFYYSAMEPSALRIALAEPFTTMRRLNVAWNDSRLSILQREHALGRLPIDEFETLKERLTHPPTTKVEVVGQNTSEPTIAGPRGRCPRCSATIPLKTQECPKCGALFGADSAWKVFALE
jgi:hypothetical protein